jgi:hypothetical protein
MPVLTHFNYINSKSNSTYRSTEHKRINQKPSTYMSKIAGRSEIKNGISQAKRVAHNSTRTRQVTSRAKF